MCDPYAESPDCTFSTGGVRVHVHNQWPLCESRYELMEGMSERISASRPRHMPSPIFVLIFSLSFFFHLERSAISPCHFVTRAHL